MESISIYVIKNVLREKMNKKISLGKPRTRWKDAVKKKKGYEIDKWKCNSKLYIK